MGGGVLIALRLVGTPQGAVSDEPTRRFDEPLITIGRAPNCHVILPDLLRIISRQHARLTVQRGEVLLTCLSASAPVLVNETTVLHGGTRPLRNGDVIHIGGFELLLACETITPEAQPPPQPQPQPPPQPPPQSLAPATPVAAPPPAPALARRARARLDEWFDLEPALQSAASAPRSPPAGPLVGVAGAAGAVDLDLRSSAYQSEAKGSELRILESLQRLRDVGREAAAAHSTIPGPSRPVAPPPAPAPPEPPAVAGVTVAPAVQTELNDEAQHALMLAFLEGAGLAQRTGTTSTQLLAPIPLTPAWMRHIGELLRASVEGALALLHSRSTVKREMRAEVTVIARRQNNPLKFAPDAPAALAHLVAARRSPGFLDPVAALKDAHEDLLVHHLAVVAGMRAAMFELIARLGPAAVLRDEGAPKGWRASLPALHEAALWRRYRQRHADMTARLDDDFEAVFGHEFTKAYEAQARRVREQAPPDETPG